MAKSRGNMFGFPQENMLSTYSTDSAGPGLNMSETTFSRGIPSLMPGAMDKMQGGMGGGGDRHPGTQHPGYGIENKLQMGPGAGRPLPVVKPQRTGIEMSNPTPYMPTGPVYENPELNAIAAANPGQVNNVNYAFSGGRPTGPGGRPIVGKMSQGGPDSGNIGGGGNGYGSGGNGLNTNDPNAPSPDMGGWDSNLGAYGYGSNDPSNVGNGAWGNGWGNGNWGGIANQPGYTVDPMERDPNGVGYGGAPQYTGPIGPHMQGAGPHQGRPGSGDGGFFSGAGISMDPFGDKFGMFDNMLAGQPTIQMHNGFPIEVYEDGTPVNKPTRMEGPMRGYAQPAPARAINGPYGSVTSRFTGNQELSPFSGPAMSEYGGYNNAGIGYGSDYYNYGGLSGQLGDGTTAGVMGGGFANAGYGSPSYGVNPVTAGHDFADAQQEGYSYGSYNPSDPSGAGATSGGCYITTAVTQALGEADDGPTLTAFRWFRDNVMAKRQDWKAAIAEYYRVAPAIAAKISDPKAVYEKWLSPALRAISAGQYELAFALYRGMVRRLQKGVV